MCKLIYWNFNAIFTCFMFLSLIILLYLMNWVFSEAYCLETITCRFFFTKLIICSIYYGNCYFPSSASYILIISCIFVIVLVYLLYVVFLFIQELSKIKFRRCNCFFYKIAQKKSFPFIALEILKMGFIKIPFLN